jgi:hypothetical protein
MDKRVLLVALDFARQPTLLEYCSAGVMAL